MQKRKSRGGDVEEEVGEGVGEDGSEEEPEPALAPAAELAAAMRRVGRPPTRARARDEACIVRWTVREIGHRRGGRR